jgi:hypothetical protein
MQDAVCALHLCVSHSWLVMDRQHWLLQAGQQQRCRI